ncbi:PHA/PHB synthase family protein [Blastococcus xanthinilyticus]|uniref:Polyhydroxyalkanoate synthase n=1 Tax=Blastococcus xanthinilyticus TaxID=1564164 RepID=A0A5S5CW62_9ACTN|nr:alpha/beta fold hydrolase [Blastococcus xanthinilyticus]TYP87845.1 polyhydroxyalkanoate synthase [Blastococcus xanthinilyticus]
MAQPATEPDRSASAPPPGRPEAAPAAGGPEEAAEAAMGLDMVLVDAARGPLRRMVPPAGTALRFGSALARRPDVVARRGGELARELGKVVIGRSELAPGKKDKRFADPAWSGNPMLRRAMQAHLATARVAWELIEDADLDWQDDERIRFTATNLVDALAPSNVPGLNPVSLKAVIDTGGASALRGLTRMVKDLANPPRVPTMVEPDAFAVGEDLAVTPGAVVYRSDVFELIQYRPTTETVRALPLVMVPPTINKYYIADLAPGRSIVEHYVASGQQVFMMSWRNPDERHAEWNLDTYGQAVLDAMDAVERITGQEQVALQAFCSGGIITAMVLAHLAATGRQDRVRAASYAVTVLDWNRAGTMSALMDPEAVQAATERSRKKGYLDGAQLAEVFAWLRPNDLVWNYWVNNYLQGKPPPNFDILFWNADTTRMTAGLHRGFIDVALGNALTKPGASTMLGSPVDLSAITVDNYVTAGIADHICPWQACYRSTQLFGGESRFILSTNGHIASLVNPPGNPKSTFQVAESTPPDPDRWLQQAETTKGSWWPDFMSWLGERSGEEIPAPAELGGNGLEMLAEAPGTYVFDK